MSNCISDGPGPDASRLVLFLLVRGADGPRNGKYVWKSSLFLIRVLGAVSDLTLSQT